MTVYIRRTVSAGRSRYLLRESYRDGDVWKHRDIMNLGEDPGRFIEYPGGNGYFFGESLQEVLDSSGVKCTGEELERIFLPYMRPHVRRVIEQFHARGASARAGRWRGVSERELMRRQGELHSFDKRRLHYLRCGRVDIGELEGRVWKFLNVLLGKSRDEIEQTIEDMEKVLRPQEIKAYLFTAFHLQSYFPHHLMRNEPTALDPEKLDECFLQEVCALNGDTRFFRGTGGHDGGSAHPYLVKYVILYFDHDFERIHWEGLLHEYVRSRQFRGSRAAPSRHVSNEEACSILGISEEECRRMDRKELIRLYRERAKKAHPDSGGDHEAFLKIQEAYESLLSRK